METDNNRGSPGRNVESMVKRPTILIVGSFSPEVSGTVVLLKHLLDELRALGKWNIICLDSGGIRQAGLSRIFHYMRFVWAMLCQSRKADMVSIQVMGTAVPYLVLPIIGCKWLHMKPVSLRLFGGWDFRGDHWVVRHLCLSICRACSPFIVETGVMANAFRQIGVPRVQVMHNHRPIPVLDRRLTPSGPARRFVYLSFVRPEKGIFELLEAVKLVNFPIEMDVYGPFYGGLDCAIFQDAAPVRYCGVVEPSKVGAVLQRYDVLVLPSYFEHEGHPGVIIEAYAIGMPVITTRWRAIPEIVDSSSGLLIDIRNAQQLAEAMTRLANDAELYRKLADGAFARRLEFSSTRWAKWYSDAMERALTPSKFGVR